jgi:hypothetical protein
MHRNCFKAWQATTVMEGDMIIRLAEGPLHTLFGTFHELLYAGYHLTGGAACNSS